MFLKNNKVVYIFIAILFIVLIFVYISDYMNKPYGNDKESIEQVIRSIEGYETGSIEILEIKDIGDDRIVPLLFNNHPAYIQLFKNPKGNYEWNHIEKRIGQTLVSFVVRVSNDNGLKIMIITNAENDVAKMEIDVNGSVFEQPINVNQHSVYWVDIAESSEGSYSLKYKYYDKDDNLIEDTN